MKRNTLSALVLASLLLISAYSIGVLAAKPPKAALTVAITEPSDGIEVENGGSFTVSGNVISMRDDAGTVETFVQYAKGEGSTDFADVDETDLQITAGVQPQKMQDLLQEESYDVSWMLTGDPGTYEVRIFSQGSTAKSGASESRTVTIQGSAPPPGIETIDAEYQDPDIGFGTSSGTYAYTYSADGVYELLIEEKNRQGTQKPVDDTTELGWIYVFENLGERQDTAFCFSGHASFTPGDSDTAFYVQEKSSGSWSTIMVITNTGVDRLKRVPLPDDTSETILIRIIDDDQSIGNKEISSLFVDQVYISFEASNEFYLADLPGGVGRRAVKIGDIDNDGMNEVVVGIESGADDQLRYYEYESGAWTESMIADTAGYLHAVAIGDVDNDGNNEVVVGVSLHPEEYELRYYKYEFGVWTEYNVADPGVTVFAVTVGDLDNDGDNEIAMGLIASDGYELRYYEYESGSWTEFNVDDALGESDGVEIADVDNDGFNELVYLGSSVSEALCYYKYETGVWNKFTIICPTGWEMDVGDVDNDGEVEIAWGSYAEPDNEVRIFKYEESGWVETYVSDVPGGASPITGVYHVAIGDLDNDGMNELAVGLGDTQNYPSDATVRYYKYDAGNWIEHNVTDTDVTVQVVEIGDIDNDGDNELLVGLSTTAFELRYYKADNPESAGTEILVGGPDCIVAWEHIEHEWYEDYEWTTENPPMDLLVIDIDSDGWPETIVAEYYC